MLYASVLGDAVGWCVGTFGITGLCAVFLVYKLFQASQKVPGPVKRAGLHYAARRFFG